MNKPLLVEYADELPEKDPDEKGEQQFIGQVARRYSEGTLQRLLDSHDARTRLAALRALRGLGTIASNRRLAECLYDDDPEVQDSAQQTLWSVWFRGDGSACSRELHAINRLLSRKAYADALPRLNALVLKAPHFAEAYNQRAILYYQIGEFRKSIEDCQRTLRLNPHHFGAQAGIGQCYLRLKRPADALKALRRAFQMNPILEGIRESIQALERMLREQRRRRDDRK